MTIIACIRRKFVVVLSSFPSVKAGRYEIWWLLETLRHRKEKSIAKAFGMLVNLYDYSRWECGGRVQV